jgi:hypothetical protein
MKDDFDFITIVVAIWVASYVAIILDYVAHSELGWSLAQVRTWAILGAVLLSIITLAGMLGGKGRKLGRRG